MKQTSQEEDSQTKPQKKETKVRELFDLAILSSRIKSTI